MFHKSSSQSYFFFLSSRRYCLQFVGVCRCLTLLHCRWIKPNFCSWMNLFWTGQSYSLNLINLRPVSCSFVHLHHGFLWSSSFWYLMPQSVVHKNPVTDVQQASNYTTETLIIYFRVAPAWVLSGIPQVKHALPDFSCCYLHRVQC